jgi:protein subunit release factor B
LRDLQVNKTSNRVSLLHVPTGLRVECQDTRSLQQNRKIARKRLRLKLDEYLNGSQSRTSLAAQKAAAKKLKSKARSRSRQKLKREANNDPASETLEDGEPSF